MPSVDVPDVVHATDVRMGDLSREPYFGKEPLTPHRIGRHRTRQELERNRLSQLDIVGAIDLTHSAATEQTDNPVAPDEHRPRGHSANGSRFRGEAVHAMRDYAWSGRKLG